MRKLEHLQRIGELTEFSGQRLKLVLVQLDGVKVFAVPNFSRDVLDLVTLGI